MMTKAMINRRRSCFLPGRAAQRGREGRDFTSLRRPRPLPDGDGEAPRRNAGGLARKPRVAPSMHHSHAHGRQHMYTVPAAGSHRPDLRGEREALGGCRLEEGRKSQAPRRFPDSTTSYSPHTVRGRRIGEQRRDGRTGAAELAHAAAFGRRLGSATPRPRRRALLRAARSAAGAVRRLPSTEYVAVPAPATTPAPTPVPGDALPPLCPWPMPSSSFPFMLPSSSHTDGARRRKFSSTFLPRRRPCVRWIQPRPWRRLHRLSRPADKRAGGDKKGGAAQPSPSGGKFSRVETLFASSLPRPPFSSVVRGSIAVPPQASPSKDKAASGPALHRACKAQHGGLAAASVCASLATRAASGAGSSHHDQAQPSPMAEGDGMAAALFLSTGRPGSSETKAEAMDWTHKRQRWELK
ncbi:hypothetical protein RJ55_02786 [Drechmeria coniospora]|nr:hypothetical protein RJ55_02786 [Drechmeria coniospora]